MAEAMPKKERIEITPPHYDDIAIVIVTYNPDQSFYERVDAILDRFKAIIIVDNSAPGIIQISRLNHQKIHIHVNNSNLGLGVALNTGCERALELGFNWAVTLDQDTELYPEYLPSMLHAWSKCRERPPILGCNYLNISRSGYKFTRSDISLTKHKTTVITSGCLTHLPTWAFLGKFRGDYFIDAIDHEYCLRARRSGFDIVINYQCLMDHTIGEPTQTHKLFGAFSPYNHSSWRTYTSTRNTMRTIIDYAASEPSWCVRKLAGLAVELLAIFFLEDKKVIRLKAFAYGLAHACTGKMGMPEIPYSS